MATDKERIRYAVREQMDVTVHRRLEQAAEHIRQAAILYREARIDLLDGESRWPVRALFNPPSVGARLFVVWDDLIKLRLSLVGRWHGRAARKALQKVLEAKGWESGRKWWFI